MENVVKCPFCNSSNKIVIAKQSHIDKYLSLIDKNLNLAERFWYKCNDCDFIYRSPRITEKEAKILYSKYRSYDFRKITPDEYFDKLTNLPDEQSETFQKAKYLKSFLNNVKINSIIDVGCGGGIFLYQLNRSFPKAYLLGLEPNIEYANMVRKRLSIDVIEDFYKEDIVKRDFDLTVSTDVIEHIHNLKIFWQVANKNIKEDKYLFIEIPSDENFSNLDIFHDVFESPHLYFFNKKHIKALSKNYEFKVVSMKKVKNRDVIKEWYILKRV